MDDAIHNFWEEIRKKGKEIIGFFYYDPRKGKYTYDVKSPDEGNKDERLRTIPFYFNPKSPEGIPVLRMGNRTYKTEEFANVDDLIKHLDFNKDRYIREMERKNPREFKRNYERLINTCEEFSNLSFSLFTELITFTFPEPLLATLRAMTLSGFESCGTINVSKLPAMKREGPEVRPPKDTEEWKRNYQLMFPYDVVFHSDLPESCEPTALEDKGDIHFHTHPLTYIEPSNDNYGDLLEFERNLNSYPSFADINSARIRLSRLKYQANMIFTYTGIYVMKYEKPVKDPEKIVKLKKLTKNDENAFERERWNCNLTPFLQEFSKDERDKYVKYYHTEEKNLPINKMDNNFREMNKRLFKIIQEIVGKNLNSLKNLDRLLKAYPNFFKDVNKYCVGLFEKYLNIDNTSGNKIIVKIIPVVKTSQERWTYSQFSIQLYPRLLGAKGAPATRRLSFQQR